MKTTFRSMSFPSLLLLAAVLSAGCSLLRWNAELPRRTFQTVMGGTEGGASIDPVDLQERLVRSADIFLVGMVTATDKLRWNGAPLSQVELQTLRIAYTTLILTLVTGPNVTTNLLDMVVVITRSRMMVEDYWLPEVYGESARQLLANCQEMETQLWRMMTPLLTTAQQGELRATLHTLHRQDRYSPAALPPQALNFVADVPKMSQK